jgi:phosphate-selective porin OprO and OprP
MTPVFLDGNRLVTVFKGQGFNKQAGYMFDNDIEMALRYTTLLASRESLKGNANDQKQYTLAMSKYLDHHRVKIMGDLSYDELLNRVANIYQSAWILRLQLEIGI